jgi:hypothetical protein
MSEVVCLLVGIDSAYAHLCAVLVPLRQVEDAPTKARAIRRDTRLPSATR